VWTTDQRELINTIKNKHNINNPLLTAFAPCKGGTRLRRGDWNYFRLPLIAAAGASPFVLKQKDQKFKTEKSFSAQGKTPWPAFPPGYYAL